MTIFEYAFKTEQIFFKNVLAENGYECFTTFYSDLTLAECAEGKKGVEDTIKNVIRNWLGDYKYFTEFIMAINMKSWEMAYRQKKNMPAPHKENPEELGKFYAEQYYALKDKFYEHYKGNEEACDYFFNTTD